MIEFMAVEEIDKPLKKRIAPKLYLEVKPLKNGEFSKIYFVRETVGGKDTRRTIGRHPDITPALAVQIAGYGVEQNRTLFDFYKQFVEKKQAVVKYKTIQRYRQYLAKFEPLTDRSIASIQPPEVYQLIEKMYLKGEHSAMMKSVQMLRAIFGIAISRGVIQYSPVPTRESMRLNFTPQIGSHSSLNPLFEEGLTELIDFIKNIESVPLRNLFAFDLCLPLRSQNAREFRIDENLVQVKGEYVIQIKGEKYKQGHEGDPDRYFGIAFELGEWLKTLDNGGYVFSSDPSIIMPENTPNYCIKTKFKSKYIVGKKKYLNFHSLRSVFSSFANKIGIDNRAVEVCLGHAIKGIEQVYNRSSSLSKGRAANEKWIEYLKGLGFDIF